MDVKKLMSEGGLDNISEDLFKSVSSYSDEVKAFQRQKAAEYADQVVAALKKIEQDIKDRYDRVGLNLEKRVLNIKDGKDGINGRDGRDGKDGKQGAQGLPGRDGKDGRNGKDGVDGKDGVSVVNAFFDFDNSLVIELSDGRQINAGAILGADFAEKVKIIANGGGTSQSVLDTLASLQAQITAISSLGAVSYQGTWNASTNTPAITGGSGTKGYYYVVSVAGSTSIDGETKWGVGDWIVFNGSAWQKVDGGSTGNLTTLDVSGASTLGGSLTLSGGTANGVAYLNGSKVVTSGSALTFDGTNFGAGAAANSLGSGITTIQATGSGTANSGGFRLRNSDGTKDAAFYIDSVGFHLASVTSTPLVFDYGNSEQMRLTSTGLGIGTTSPGVKLHVYAGSGSVEEMIQTAGSASANLNLRNSDRYWTVTNQSGGSLLIFDTTAGATRMAFDTSGNVGIGTSSPSLLFQVSSRGGMSSSGVFYWGQALTGNSRGQLTWDTDKAIIESPLTLAFNTSSTERMRLDSSGNLGIGTSSPLGKLDVRGTAYFNGTGAGSGASQLIAAFAASSGANFGQLINTGATWSLGYGSSYSSVGTSVLTWDASGNLGLGVTPSGWDTFDKVFQFGAGAVANYGLNNNTMFGSNTYYNGGFKYISSDTATNYRQYAGQHQWFTAPSGTAGNAITFTQAMTLDASGNLGVGVTSVTSGYRIRVQDGNSATGFIATNASGGYCSIGLDSAVTSDGRITWTNALIFGASGAERMRIDSSGNLLVGTTSQLIGTNALLNLNYNNGANYGIVMRGAAVGSATHLYFVNSSGTVQGSIISTGSGSTAFNTSSDYRLKEAIAPMTGALAKVAALKPVTYKWKSDGSDGEGFIAHELAEVCPHAVSGEKDAVDTKGNPVYQGIDTSFLVATLTAAIQELKEEVDSLKAQLNK